MTISLQDPETDRLARAVADLTGESVADAIRNSLAERLARENARHAGPVPGLAERLHIIGAHCASLPDYDVRTPDEIIGYDETGLW